MSFKRESKKRSKDKKVKSTIIPNIVKYPRSIYIKNYLQETPVWKFSIIDLDGKWSCANIDRDMMFSTILPRIKSFETMKWSEIIGRDHHDIPKSDLCYEAQRRLEEINQEDIDYLFSFRIDNIKRLLCIRDN